MTRTSPTAVRTTARCDSTRRQAAHHPCGQAEQAGQGDDCPQSVKHHPVLAETHRLPRTDAEPERDVSRPDRDGEQQQRPQRDGRRSFLPQCPVTEDPCAQVAEHLAVKDTEQDRPGRAEKQYPDQAGDLGCARGMGGEPSTGKDREYEQQCAVPDVTDHRAEHQRQERSP